jgi:hypothetical protein
MASGTSKASMRTRSPFFRAVENPVRPSASWVKRGSMIMGNLPITPGSAPRKRVLGKADPADRLVKVGRAADDLDLEPQVVDGQRAAARAGDADRVLLGRHQALRPSAPPRVEVVQVLRRVAVVVEEALAADQERPRSRRNFSKLSGVAMPLKAKTRRPFSHSSGSRPPRRRARVQALQVLRPVRALDDVGVGLVPGDHRLELRVPLAVGLRQEDVVRAAQVLHGLAQDAAGQQVPVPEGVRLVDEQQVEPALERQVLEAVVEDQRVAPELLDRVGPGLHPVLVHEDDDPGQVARQHVRLVAGLLAVEQHVLAVAHDPRRRLVRVGDPVPGLLPERGRLALVAPAEDRDLAAPVPQGLGELLDDGGLARPARPSGCRRRPRGSRAGGPSGSVAVEPEPQLDDAAEEPGGAFRNVPKMTAPCPPAAPARRRPCRARTLGIFF